MPGYHGFTDQELSSLLNQGDEKAYTEVYERYYSLLYVYAYKKLHNRQESEDIVQEVLIALWNKRFVFHLERSLTAYLFTAVRNRALDLFSRKKIESRYVESLQRFVDDSGSSADFLVRENDLRNLIQKEIDALPPRMREVFSLSRSNLLSHREIADVMDISEQTVTTQIKKALRVLRVRLGLLSLLPCLLQLNLTPLLQGL
jgi:RNA polymerase sigma-70 factor (family 1)